MTQELVEVAVHLLLLLGYTLLAIGLFLGGLMIEYSGYAYALGGEVLLAAWIAAIGGVVLFFSYLLVREKIVVEYQWLRS